MKATSKIVVALLMAAFLLMGCAGKCLQAANASATSSSCHQKNHIPSPEDRGKPSCVYLMAFSTSVLNTGDADHTQHAELGPIDEPLVNNAEATPLALSRDVLSSGRQRFLSLHQLRI
jgi:hypothetical protein